jgi:peroxin-11B
MEHLQAALRAAAVSGPAGEQIATIGRQLGYFGYLVYDALVWVSALCDRSHEYIDLSPAIQANAVKFITLNPETAQKVAKTSNRLWLTGILFSIIHGLLKSGRLATEAKRLRTSGTWGEKDLGEEADREVKSHAVDLSVTY